MIRTDIVDNKLCNTQYFGIYFQENVMTLSLPNEKLHSLILEII